MNLLPYKIAYRLWKYSTDWKLIWRMDLKTTTIQAIQMKNAILEMIDGNVTLSKWTC